MHGKAPALFEGCAGLSHKTKHPLLDDDDKPPWLSIAHKYIQIYLTLKPLWNIFSLQRLRIFASRAGRRPPLVVCARGWRQIAAARPSEDELAGSSPFCHHGSESCRWMTKTYSSPSGSEDPDGQRPLWFAGQRLISMIQLISFSFLISCSSYLEYYRLVKFSDCIFQTN